jgi:hypothetical protein
MSPRKNNLGYAVIRSPVAEEGKAYPKVRIEEEAADLKIVFLIKMEPMRNMLQRRS